ncbi:MAG: enoyl-CoA hydratase/isomerase family protein [Actinobacteria bacterium]|nr:enoyl-CoA hydratase/isomerase family protein [Actinomycetota bacterium]MBT3746237.1 enoyl-CoA hydratase/isomerase family protein [Actinomycetota bacterium]MBT3969366.1 enoyl-CoA hydratase/isomerase family protein [Actinomycetota bacterium]MBT4010232.1 enoyl-CoA hydratase/isomerase family protein [Actinomycetota bacterium]MBT4303513.1 enoyl-CoA hydratase/isomerase family protein [Actinomycetota bacterium]
MIDFEFLHFERHQDVLVVTIDNPADPLNKVDEQMHHELTNLFKYLRNEREARAVLLAGSNKAFTAGGDFGWFPSFSEPGYAANLRLDGKSIIWDLLDLHLPLVSAVTGHAMGLGASIALLSDITVMSETARLGDPHVQVGIVAGDGGTIAWPLALGPQLAKRFLLTGDPLTAVEAERLGLIVETASDPDACLTAGLAWAKRLAGGAPQAVQYTKQAINSWIKQTCGPAFDLATALETVTFASQDFTEALSALQEKRPPKFTGK